MEGRTHACGNRRGGFLARGEKPNELGDSWFSAKSIEVGRAGNEKTGMAKGVEYSMGEGGETLADPMETPNTLNLHVGGSWCALRTRAARLARSGLLTV